jgi:hypothetical protein
VVGVLAISHAVVVLWWAILCFICFVLYSFFVVGEYDDG